VSDGGARRVAGSIAMHATATAGDAPVATFSPASSPIAEIIDRYRAQIERVDARLSEDIPK
jgi:hypothetical protein